MKTTTIILALFLWGCGTNEERLPGPFLRRIDRPASCDTIYVHDTVYVVEDIETIVYYKNQSLKLWEAIEIMGPYTPHLDELDRIDYELMSAREKHNSRVHANLVKDLERILKK